MVGNGNSRVFNILNTWFKIIWDKLEISVGQQLLW